MSVYLENPVQVLRNGGNQTAQHLGKLLQLFPFALAQFGGPPEEKAALPAGENDLPRCEPWNFRLRWFAGAEEFRSILLEFIELITDEEKVARSNMKGCF